MPQRHEGSRVHKGIEAKNYSSRSFVSLSLGGKIQADEWENAGYCILLDSGLAYCK